MKIQFSPKALKGNYWSMVNSFTEELKVKSKQCLFMVIKIPSPWIYISLLQQSNLMICLLSLHLNRHKASVFPPHPNYYLFFFLGQYLKYITILEFSLYLGICIYNYAHIYLDFNVQSKFPEVLNWS